MNSASPGRHHFESALMPAVQVAPQRGYSLEEGSSALNPSDRAFWIGLCLVLLSLVSAFATYIILTGLSPIAPRNEVVLTVLFLNVVLIVAMIVLLTRQIIGLARAWKQRTPGAAAHPHRRPVLHHRGAADAAPRHRRDRHLRALARR